VLKVVKWFSLPGQMKVPRQLLLSAGGPTTTVNNIIVIWSSNLSAIVSSLDERGSTEVSVTTSGYGNGADVWQGRSVYSSILEG
jgi:hypothetical protein